MNNKNKKQKKVVAVLAVVLISLIGILVFGFLLNSDREKQPDDTVCIETPYGSLYYPDKWKDSITTEIDETNGYIITFVGEVNGNQVKLFSVSFGENESVQIGTLKTEDEEEIAVGVEFFTLEETVDWDCLLYTSPSPRD